MTEIANDISAVTPYIQVYNPSELLTIFSDVLARQNTSSKVIYLRGVYFKQRYNPNYPVAYDLLRDENNQQELTIAISPMLREEIKDGALVQVGGVITRKVSNKGFIQLIFQVSRLDVVKEQVISEDDIKKSEFRTLKSQRGFKNVDSILEEILYRGERPKVALIFASTSITMADFDAGKDAAAAHIDFEEYRVSFSKSAELINLLKGLDANDSYDTIALIRGGGSGIEALDDLSVLECVANMVKPLICAIGHVEENIFIKNLADKVAPTPNGLGTYFSNMVETVIQKRNNSRAALVEEVKKQYISQIQTAEKQNKTLQEQIEKMTKASAEAQANFKVQSDTLNKQLTTLQDNLKSLQKTNEEQAKKFNETLTDLQKANGTLQDSLNKITAQNAETNIKLALAENFRAELESQVKSKERQSGVFAIIAIVAVLIAILLQLF